MRYHDGYWPDTRYAYGTDAKKEAVAAIPTGEAVSADDFDRLSAAAARVGQPPVAA